MPRLPVLIGVACLFLTGCTVGPNYQRPQLSMPASWQAARPHAGSTQALVNWWSGFGDPALTQLQQWAESDSPSLDVAVARITQARATLTTSHADALPAVTASASHTRAQQTFQFGATPSTTRTTSTLGGLDASWELDLFGRVHRNNQAARARIEARENDWNDARISLAAEVADSYAQYRGCRQLAGAYRQQMESQEETTRLTRLTADAGFTAPSDLALADAAAASVRSSYIDQQSQCDLLVKTLVSLTGKQEEEIRELLAAQDAVLPQPPSLSVTSVPADVLRQRPDVASSERELAAASAEIGAAIADLYPSLSLSGTISIGVTNGAGAKNWSFGPTLSLPLFDAGKRRANVRSVRAAYDIQLATYRQTVRDAVREVEEALVQLDAARSRESDAERAAQGYRANFAAIEQLRRAGNASMVEREQARRNALDAERSLINVRVTRVRQWIALYRALGGGWQPDSPPLTRASSSAGVSP